MSQQRRQLTSSGVLGAPEGGATLIIVPGQCVSSSCIGQKMTWSDTRGVKGFVVRNYEREFPPILRLRGGGEDKGGGEDPKQQAGPPSPVVGSQGRPGPRCSKGREKEQVGQGKDKKKKEKDWMEKRRIQPSSSEEEKEMEEGKMEEDEEYIPESPLEITRLSKEVCEGVRRKLRSYSENIASTSGDMPRIVAVTTLVGSNRIRVPSPGMKRGREEEMEVVREEESGEDGDESRPSSSRDSSRSRDGEAPANGPQVKKVCRPGRPAKDPSHEGQFTEAKVRQRAKKREMERIEEREVEILNPEEKAMSARAEAVDRRALTIMDELRELPNPELTERALRAIETIKKVASKSRNMKGSFVGALWRTTEELTALNLAFTARLRGKEGATREGEEVDRLRTELSNMRTEHALMGGVNRWLREQVAELRDRVVQGEKPAPPPTEHATQRKGKGRRKEKGPKAIISDSSSTDVEMEEALNRELSPQARQEGIMARKEVREDLQKGTLPPAMRPAIMGKRRDLDAGLGERAVPPTPTRPPISGPSMGISQEDVDRMIQSAISRLIPQLGGTGAQTDKGEEARASSGPTIRVLPNTATAAPNKEEAGIGKGGGKKKRKRKGKKGKGSASQQGGVAPKGTGSPAPNKVPLTKGPTPLPRNKSSAPPPLDRTGTSGGGAKKSPGPGETWAQVTKNGKVRKEEKKTPEEEKQETGAQSPKSKEGEGRGKTKTPLPKNPRGAAVTLTCPEGRYAEMVTAAREGVNLTELGISGMRTRRAITGALILEIPGSDGAEKADSLRSKLVELFKGREDFKVSRPIKCVDLRLRDLDDSVTADDVRRAVAESGSCKTSEVTVGIISRASTRLGTSWLRCPVVAARKLVALGRLTVGWSSARVEALPQRPLQCFRCMEWGHVRAKCPSSVDRTGVCFRCGSAEHKAGGCTAPLACIICKGVGKAYDHRMGSKGCRGAAKGSKRGGMKRKESPQHPSSPHPEGKGTKESSLTAEAPKEQRPPRVIKGASKKEEHNAVGVESTPMEVCPEEADLQP